MFYFLIALFFVFGIVMLIQSNYALEKGVFVSEVEKDEAQEWLNYHLGLLTVISSDVSNFYSLVERNKNKFSKSDLNICNGIVALQATNARKILKSLKSLSIRKLRKYLNKYGFNGTTLKVLSMQSIIEIWANQSLMNSIRLNVNNNKFIPTVCDEETIKKSMEAAIIRMEGILNGNWRLSKAK